MKAIAPLLKMPRSRSAFLALLADALACPISVWLAFYLRLGEVTGFAHGFHVATSVSIAIAIPIFYLAGFYRTVMRHATWGMLIGIVRSLAIYGAIFATIFTLIDVPGVPRTVGLIQPILLFLGVGCTRAIVGYWFGNGGYRRRRAGDVENNILIYGAGASGRQLASAIAYSGSLRVLGFIDDAVALHGRRLGNISIYGPEELPALIRKFQVEEVLLALPSVQRSRRNQIVRLLYDLDVRVRTMPGLMDLASGRAEVSDLRAIEIEDLLGRNVIAPDSDLLAHDIAGKIVLVTGAGGSIGGELCRQIVKVRPTTLLLVESSEFALYAINQELEKAAADIGQKVSIIPLLASVRDPRRMEEVIGTWGPHTIYHAAAYKHVPLVEHNPAEGVLNNVFGTMITAQAARRHGVLKFVLISTDKAVRPTNVMGTSKRVAEMVLQALAAAAGTTCFTMVRFGNVLGSSGSVVPLFRQQIEAGGPITITHRDINRYFMTIPEAAQLVIQAGAMARGGEVFVLDMGQPVRIVDLARNMVELSGLTIRDSNHPDGDIEICEVGLRPGEKLYEELLIGDNPESTPHARIMKANEQFVPWAQLELALNSLREAVESDDIGALKRILCSLVPEFRTTSDVVDWVGVRRAVNG